MKLVSWNFRGLGRPSAVRGLKHLVWNTSPLALSLIETKENLNRMEKISKVLPFENSVVDKAFNGKGGLAFF